MSSEDIRRAIKTHFHHMVAGAEPLYRRALAIFEKSFWAGSSQCRDSPR
jgi:hypothetical protein